jgi:orotate phosphoribosyltransferase
LSAKDLKEAGAIVKDVMIVIERNIEGRLRLEEEGLNLHSLFKMEDLLKAATE